MQNVAPNGNLSRHGRYCPYDHPMSDNWKHFLEWLTLPKLIFILAFIGYLAGAFVKDDLTWFVDLAKQVTP